MRPAGQAEHRCRRHPRRARRVDRSGGEDGQLLACTLYGRSGTALRSRLRPREGRDRRRQLAHARLGEPERALALQRHRDEHRHPRPRARGKTRLRLWAEHLELAIDGIPADPIQAIDELWKPISLEQLERRDAGLPLTHRLVRLPNLSSGRGVHSGRSAASSSTAELGRGSPRSKPVLGRHLQEQLDKVSLPDGYRVELIES